MWMRIATTESFDETYKALKKALNESICPMPIESMGEAEAGEVAAVVTKDSVQFSRFVEETFEPPDGAKFYIMRT